MKNRMELFCLRFAETQSASCWAVVVHCCPKRKQEDMAKGHDEL
jgi:hypothetical protein